MRALPVAGPAGRASRRCSSSTPRRRWRSARAGCARGSTCPPGCSSGSRSASCAPSSRTSTHHGALRDPLRLAVSRVLCQALFFLPVLRPLHDRYADVAELDADAAALEASVGATAPLASAMLAFGSHAVGRRRRHLARAGRLAARPAAGLAAAPDAADRRARDARRARRARLARERQRLGPGDAQSPDRLLAALRARPGARARRWPASPPRWPAAGARDGAPHVRGG